MAEKVKSAPKTTVFSTDPKTGKPYMTAEHAASLIAHHINNYASYILAIEDIDDAVQTILIGFCRREYKPTLCAPKTFAIQCIQGGVNRMNKMSYRKKNTTKDTLENGKPKFRGDLRYAVRPIIHQERVEIGLEGHNVSSLDIKPELTTPLDLLLVKETVQQFNDENWERVSAGRKPLDRPNGYEDSLDVILPDKDKLRECTKCKKHKPLRTEFYKNKAKTKLSMVYHSACKDCQRQQKRFNKEKKLRKLSSNSQT